jgi:hypothetical protein
LTAVKHQCYIFKKDDKKIPEAGRMKKTAPILKKGGLSAFSYFAPFMNRAKGPESGGRSDYGGGPGTGGSEPATPGR